VGRVETWRHAVTCAMLVLRWSPGGQRGRATSAVERGRTAEATPSRVTPCNPYLAPATRQEG